MRRVDTRPDLSDDLLDDPIATLQRRGPLGRLLGRILSGGSKGSTDPIRRALRLRRRVAYAAAAMFLFYAWYVTNHAPAVEIAPPGTAATTTSQLP
jgi:hypothetical protein